MFITFLLLAKAFTDTILKSVIDFAPQVIFGNIWRHYLLSQMAKDCHLHLVGGGQKCC